nr:retrovirus-related Pol polyprotein from transposon TNT 1-94 [Tanacetum cinerariifolium]
MSRDVLTVGSTMRIPLLYRGEYSQWVARFMNYLEEQTDGEAMINCIKKGDQPLPRVTQVSMARTSSTEQPPLKDKSMWSDQEKKIQKIDRLARSLLIQGLPNDIYSLIDSNKTAKDLWDALARHMLGSEYGEQDRKAAVLYEYEKFKATEGELLLDTYIRYLFKEKTVVVTSDPLALIAEKTKVSKIKEKVVSSDSEGSDADDFSQLKKITALLAKAFNRRKFYSKPTNNNLRTSTSQSANKKQEFVKTNDKKVEKKDDEKKRDMSKKDKDEQVLLAEDQAWMESSSDSDREINANMVFMAHIEKVVSHSEDSTTSADDKISAVSYYLSESESESEYETSEYYDNTTTYGLFVDDNDDQEIFHDCENFSENLIESQIDHNESDIDHNDCEGIDKLIRKFNKKIAECLKRIEKANQQNKDFENQNKDLQDKYDVLKNQATTFEMKNKELNDQLRVLIERNENEYFDKIDSPFQQTSSLKPYVPTVILEKIIIDLEDEVHQRLSHLNFATINNLVKNNLVQGLPKMKFEKDHLCSACEQGKIHRKHHKSKTAFASNKPLYLLNMDLYGPMRVESINEKRYVLVVVDDYSRYTWRVRTDNGTEFKNKTLAKFFDEVGITQQFSAARTPQQNGVVKRRNQTLVEAARTMHTFANLPMFLWAEAIATACFTHNRSIIHKRFDKTPYELMNKRKPNIKFFRVFGCRCYLLNDYEDVEKLKAKRDIKVFVGYSKESVAFRIYNKRTQESSSSFLNDDVHQSLEEVAVPSSNTQSISNNMIPNVDEASTSHNVFNERLEDAYFDATLRDADWVSAMQEEL